MSAEEATGGPVRITLRIQPRASREAVRVEPDGCLRVAVTAPPVDDAANEALCRLLAKQLGVGARQVTLVQGARAREKVVEVEGLTSGEVFARLSGG